MALKDDLLKHQILLQRMMPKHANIIKSALQKAIVPASKNLGRNQLRRSLSALFAPALDNSIKAYKDLLAYDVKFTQKILNKYSATEIAQANIGDATAKLLTDASFTTSLNKKSITLPSAFSQYFINKTDELVNVSSDADLQQKTPEEKNNAVRNIVLGLMFVQAVALTRTAINHTSTVAKSATIEENKIERWQWIATLDNTCDFCEEQHKQIFEYGDEEPPAHANCHCVVVPINE